MAYDYGTGKVILYGGYDNNASHSEYGIDVEYTYDTTWSYLGGTWTDLTPTNTTLTQNLTWYPPRSDDAYMEYNPAVGGLLMYEGDYQVPPLNDEWTYINGTWALVCSSCVASYRSCDHSAWDPPAGAVVSFGPSALVVGPGQTWIVVVK